QPPLQPVDECLSFLDKTQWDQRVERECRISQPCEAIIPIAHSANLFGQGKCRRCNQRSMLPADQQLQHYGRTVKRFAPPAIVLCFRDPSLPEMCWLS